MATLFLWSGLTVGQTAKWVTSPVVIGEAALLFLAAWQLAARHHRATAAFACAPLASSSVLLWGVATGR